MSIAGAWVPLRLRQRRADAGPLWIRARSDALVGDLAAALGLDPASGLVIDGRPARSQDELREIGLCQGSVVTSVGGESTSNPRLAGAVILSVRSGMGAGRMLVLDTADRPIGRSQACDLVLEDASVELLHATVRLREDRTAIVHLLADPGAGPHPANTTHRSDPGGGRSGRIAPDRGAPDGVVLAVGDRMVLGRTELELRIFRPEDRLAGTDTTPNAPLSGSGGPGRGAAGPVNGRGTILLNRPPRVGAPPPSEPLPVPRRPPASNATPLAVAAVVLPLLIAAVLVTITGSWLFGLLTVLSPLLMVANWWSSRRTQRRERVRSGVAFSRQVRQFEDQARTRRDRHDLQLAARAVDVGEVLRRALLPARTLWERRLGDHDGLRVLLGWADHPWLAPLASLEGLEDPVLAAALTRVQEPAWGPVELQLGRDPVVGLVGDREAARAVARSLVLQLVVHHGPADVATVAVVPPSCRAWDWLGWLPHALLDAGGPPAPTPRLTPHGRSMEHGRSLEHESSGSAGSGGEVATSGTTVLGELDQLLRRAHTPPSAGLPGLTGAHGDQDVRARHVLVVVEDEAALLGRGSPLRSVLRGELGPAVAVVLASSPDRLPASCGVVIEVGADGTGRLRTMADGTVLDGVALMGAPEEVAIDLAASLARFEDPELAVSGGGVPDRVGLLELLCTAATLPASSLTGAGGDDLGQPGGEGGSQGSAAADDPAAGDPLVDALLRSWSAPAGAGVLDELPAVIGSGAHGPTLIDLVADGPHALVAGTTGAGKSELLRSWIVSMAATTSPELLNFVLIDFKGGSAFDACARLPHTVAVVTDLDAELAERALRCLQAELAHRERVLRAAGVSDIAELGRTPGPVTAAADRPDRPDRADRLARLVVVIDEFATLAAELPGFVDSLVGIAQRGRSLGLHLILATQRPAGVVNDNIRANTNIRIALRVQDRADSLDVIEQPDAANLARQRPGRAMVRLGRNELTETQTAFSGAVGEPGQAPAVQRLDRPSGAGAAGSDPTAPAGPPVAGTDLDRLVMAAGHAARVQHMTPPRVPWPPALPATVAWPTKPAGASGDRADGMIPFLLVDDPDHQTQEPGGWDPGQGNLAVFGTSGSGTSTALVALCLALAERHDPRRLALHILGDDPAFTTLSSLPQVVNVIGRNDRERFSRLLAALEAELTLRRAGAPSSALVVFVIDGLGSLVAELSEVSGLSGLGIAGSALAGGGAEDVDRLSRIMADGPPLGIYVVAGTDHPGTLRHRMLSALPQRLVLRLSDPLDARHLGVPPITGPPGRGRLVGCCRACQVLFPQPLAALVAQLAGVARSVAEPDVSSPARRVVQCLAERVGASQLVAVSSPPQPDPGVALWLPVGIGGIDLAAVGWWLRPGEGVLVAGPARSGRSTALLTMAATLQARRVDAALYAVSSTRSPLSRAPHVQHLAPEGLGDLRAIPARESAAVLLVDDIEGVEDPASVMASLLAAGWMVIGAGRTEALRSAYGHWSRALRVSRSGLLLRADRDLDGDLLGVRLPRRAEAPLDLPGRGYLVNEGAVTLVQTAHLDMSP
ncbi:MAG: FtsK/SpoIIIE domain-containing protein [Acidimicrobiales bacterium]